MSKQSVEQRLQHLEDIHEVEQLVARYMMGGDTRNDPAIMGGCLTQNVKAIFPAFAGGSEVQGRDAFTQYVHEAAHKTMLWTVHYSTTPVVRFNSDGQTGTAFFYLWELARFRTSSDAPTESTWIGGWYENEIAKEEGHWRFSKVELVLQVFSPAHDVDWKPRMPERRPPPVWI